MEEQASIVLVRYARQNGLTEISRSEGTAFASRLLELIQTRGLPPRLRPDEMGQPGEMSADAVGPLVARLLEGSSRQGELSAVARQLVKACFHPEFKKCRESYREIESDGTCRRQTLARVQTRVSGSHCVDCPYWTALRAEQHAEFLAEGWVGNAAELTQHREIFLPEDFRVFRQLLREYAFERESN